MAEDSMENTAGFKEYAYAKINLTLSVLSKRDDGYHEIDSLMHSISIYDSVMIRKAEEMTLAVLGGGAPEGKENLVWRAAELFLEEIQSPDRVVIQLFKMIPSCAGLGGGSSDAAATLRLLNRIYGEPFSLEELANLGARLGADVPFCVMGGAARCLGIGEKLTPVPALPKIPALIVVPPVAVSTKEAYAEIDRRKFTGKYTTEAAVKALFEGNTEALFASLSNDFESALFPVNPVLSKTAKELRKTGCPVLMSGSGSAFCLFAPTAKRNRLYKTLCDKHPEWNIMICETCDGREK